jgi:hypothetical protein
MDAALGEGGGSQPQVLEDQIGDAWMTKAQNNPQGLRVLVNEFVASAIGRRLLAAVQPAAVLEVPPELASEVKHDGGAPWLSGPSFASRLIDSPASYVPDMLDAALDLVGLAKVAVLDEWLGFNDGRQARATRVESRYDIRAVDFGHAIGSPNWTTADLDGRAIPTLIRDPNGWLGRVTGDDLEQMAADVQSVTDEDIDEVVRSIPVEWAVTDEERKSLSKYLMERRSVMVVLLEHRAGATA